MSYADYLRDVLRPLRIYDLDDGIGADEINVEGAELDEVFQNLEAQLCEMIPLTAEGYGLERYETILPYKPLWESLADRRKAIAALSAVTGFSLDDINKSLLGIGIEAAVSEYGPETVSVSFPSTDGTPGDFDGIKKRVEQILPCHLNIVYEIVYITWEELAHENFTWQSLEYEELTWLRLQLYNVEV